MFEVRGLEVEYKKYFFGCVIGVMGWRFVNI